MRLVEDSTLLIDIAMAIASRSRGGAAIAVFSAETRADPVVRVLLII